MKTLISLLITGAVALTLTGCVAGPTTATPTASAYQLGDRITLGFDEIVISLPLKEAAAPYQNLHLVMGVIINPVGTDTAAAVSSYKSDYSDEAASLIRRQGPRINASISAAIMDQGTQSVREASLIRKKAVAQAESVLTAALHNWTHAADYKIEVTVLNLYWTDPSVGHLPQATATRW